MVTFFQQQCRAVLHEDRLVPAHHVWILVSCHMQPEEQNAVVEQRRVMGCSFGSRWFPPFAGSDQIAHNQVALKGRHVDIEAPRCVKSGKKLESTIMGDAIDVEGGW